MERIIVRITKGQRAINELQVAVQDDLIPLIRRELDETVFSTSDSEYAVTFDLNKPVPDVVRYWISAEEWNDEPTTTGIQPPPGERVFPWGRRATEEQAGGVVILLESPHRSETSPSLEPYAPAAGVTVGEAGYQLHKQRDALLYLMTRRLGVRFVNRTPVVVMNPLQFPASLRVSIEGREDLRDAVWVGAMQLDIFRDDFFERLDRSRPRVIVNACTGGKHDMGSPKAITRCLVDQWLYRNDLTAVTRLFYQQTRKKHHGTGKNVPLIRLETEEIENPDCSVIEVPHPSGWRYGDWFPWDLSYQEWRTRRP